GRYCWDIAIRTWSRPCGNKSGGPRIPALATSWRLNGASGYSGSCHRRGRWALWGRGPRGRGRARGAGRRFSGARGVLKFAGHFHGWNDFLIPGDDPSCAPVPGVSYEVAADTVIVPPNDPAAVEKALTNDPRIGCVILEATGGHFGAVPIRGDFLRALRDLTERYGRLLIFDEVISGFRVHPGGAQAYYGVTPGLTTLAKILAGGLPGGCVAGRADILANLEFRRGRPKMKHPGTFNANPLSAAAGIATLRLVATGEPCRQANDMGRLLRRRLNTLFADHDVNW